MLRVAATLASASRGAVEAACAASMCGFTLSLQVEHARFHRLVGVPRPGFTAAAAPRERGSAPGWGLSWRLMYRMYRREHARAL